MFVKKEVIAGVVKSKLGDVCVRPMIRCHRPRKRAAEGNVVIELVLATSLFA